MRIAFGDLPIGARFETYRVPAWQLYAPALCVKVADRKYRELSTRQVFEKSPGVYVDCIECELRLAVLRARQQRIDQ